MRLAVTGHRPDKLGGYHEWVYRKLRALAKSEIQRLKPEYVLTGMALGWDMAVADACLEIDVPFKACVPFVGQELYWRDEAQAHYRELLLLAQEVIVVSTGHYAGYKMHHRNAYMVDNSDHLLALWDGSPGGTGSCVKYAQKKLHPISNCWQQWIAQPTTEPISGQHYTPSDSKEAPF